ncbi:hypothetical protein GUJ93_ZPchr0012g20448 [Zizania palustris]|uniref:Uncharacterized protein n=1 Tax=Zizania palustris TaxID=103762 RepID=A0A8J6BQR9_ZIZPA|nr:hypothetical protein GUJ93_ZPchr0012g20448 [Zizania palustris]
MVPKRLRRALTAPMPMPRRSSMVRHCSTSTSTSCAPSQSPTGHSPMSTASTATFSPYASAAPASRDLALRAAAKAAASTRSYTVVAAADANAGLTEGFSSWWECGISPPRVG